MHPRIRKRRGLGSGIGREAWLMIGLVFSLGSFMLYICSGGDVRHADRLFSHHGFEDGPQWVRGPGMQSDALEDRPKRYRASIDIKNALQQCKAKSSLRAVIEDTLQRKCQGLNDLNAFVCKLQCDVEEPELEASFRIFRTSKYTYDHLWRMCRKGDLQALIWIYQNVPRFYICGGRDHVQGRKLFESTRTLLSTLSCMVELPDVLFGLDTLDWAVPKTQGDVPGWFQPLPGVLRFTGTTSHPTLLMPTDAYVAATTHCALGGAPTMRQKLEVCQGLEEEFAEKPWQERKKIMFWRGSSTGIPLDPLIEEYLPRPALIHQFYKEPGFDIGFVGGQPPSRLSSYKQFFFEHSKPSVRSHEYTNYKFILHCDGHTASWGLAQKLTTNSLVVWIPSNFQYREFYYRLLQPWKHYVPVDSDLSNLRDTRDWLFSAKGDAHAERIAREAREFLRTRLRPEATYCYLVRLLYSLGNVQKDRPTREFLETKTDWNLDKFMIFEEWARLNNE